MPSIADEVGENSTCVVHVEEFRPEDKCFCVRWLYRANRRQFTRVYFGLTILILCFLVAAVLIPDKMTVLEIVIDVSLIPVTFVYLALVLFMKIRFHQKEEYMNTTQNNPFRGEGTSVHQQRQPPIILDEEVEEIPLLGETDSQQNDKIAVREDITSPQEEGVEILSEEGYSNMMRRLSGDISPFGSQESLNSSADEDRDLVYKLATAGLQSLQNLPAPGDSTSY